MVNNRSTESVIHGESRQRSGNTRVLVFLIVLFALTTVALSVVLAVTILRLDDNRNSDDDVTVPCPTATSTGNQGGQHGPGQPTPQTQAPHRTQAPAQTQPPSRTQAPAQTQPPSRTQAPAQTQPPSHAAADDICLTEGCVLAAARVASAMDVSVNPCDDFYKFACGTWLKQNVIPEDKSSYGTFTKLRDDVVVIMKIVLEAAGDDKEPESAKKARNYYTACSNTTQLDHLGLAYIHEYTESLYGLPSLDKKAGGKWNESAYSLEALLSNTRKGSNSLSLIDIGVGQDDKNPTQHMIFMDQPSLGLPSRDYYLKGRDDKVVMAYQTMIKNVLKELGAEANVAENDAATFIDMEIDIANISVPLEERRDPEKLYNKMTVGELKQNFSGVDWKTFISEIFTLTGEAIGDSEPIVVTSPAYFDKLDDVILRRYSARDIANYVVTSKVLSKIFYLPQIFRDYNLAFEKVLSGRAVDPPRWQSCADSVTGAMPEVAGRLFVDEAFKGGAREDVLDLVGKLRVSIKAMIEDVTWMSSNTKVTARDKADFIEPRIGYPDVVFNNTALDEKWKSVEVFADDPLKSLVNFGKASVIRQLEKLREPYDRSKWGMSAATVNAYYSPTSNQISFPAAILQPPFYSKDQPAYLNYGGIGFVIGHEITHGFDDQGRLFDKYGNLHNWWSALDTANFKQRAQCIIDQYSNFSVPGTGMTLNGVNTQGENIADNGGIKESFKAYRTRVAEQGKEDPKLPGLSYTANQLYFLNAAQIWCTSYKRPQLIKNIYAGKHSIGMFRVYGPMQNFDEFSKAWNCPSNSYMNRAHKCSVW